MPNDSPGHYRFGGYRPLVKLAAVREEASANVEVSGDNDRQAEAIAATDGTRGVNGLPATGGLQVYVIA